jgi:hypothetical protein
MAVPGKCHFDGEGKLRGDVSVTYNEPFPCRNGSFGSGAMDGVIMHTMVGNLPGTVATFNDSARQASAHFGIDQQGNVHQFGPIGKGWIAWAQVAGNRTYYSIEHADNADPNNPLTEAQIAASAQIVEALSAFAGFPLQEANEPGQKGYGVHYMGGAAYGGHSCPDLPPRHVRSQQRPAILALAKSIREGGTVATITTSGTDSLHQVAGAHKLGAAHLIRMQGGPGQPFPSDLADYINNVLAAKIPPTAPLKKGIKLRVP